MDDLDLLRNRMAMEISTQLSQVGIAALNEFLALPGISRWNPEQMLGAQVSPALDVGLAFSLLRGNQTANVHRREVANAICRNELASPSLISEIHAGALFSHWGAKVEFVPRESHPTPDIRVSWNDGSTVDVEVTRGEVRQLHANVKKGTEDFAGVVRASEMRWHLVGFIADASNDDDLSAMVGAAINLQPGHVAEATGRWTLRALPLDRRDDVVGAHVYELFAPEWWPKGEPVFAIISSVIGGPSSPVVWLRSLVPLASYISPILNKANRRQRREGNAHVIALDVSDLPNAHVRLLKDLPGYFQIWDHVSAVLLFEPRLYFGYDRKEWLVSLHRNPFATVQLPPGMAFAPNAVRFPVEFMLSDPT